MKRNEQNKREEKEKSRDERNEDEEEEREMKIIAKYYLPATVVLPSREADTIL